MKFLILLTVSLFAPGEPVQVCTSRVKTFCSTKMGGAPATACMANTCPGALATSNGDSAFKRAMVASHNKYRRKAFKKQFGTDMLEVSWDESLAVTALNWMHQHCINGQALTAGHDQCRVTPRYNSVGQNIAWFTGNSRKTGTEIATTSVKMWYSEISLASNKQMFPYKGSAAIGHYTQLMWSRSFKIGCGYVMKSHPHGVQTWIACNYAPAGNYRGSNVFAKGSRLGSKCPVGSGKSSSGLCKVTDEAKLRASLGLLKT